MPYLVTLGLCSFVTRHMVELRLVAVYLIKSVD